MSDKSNIEEQLIKPISHSENLSRHDLMVTNMEIAIHNDRVLYLHQAAEKKGAPLTEQETIDLLSKHLQKYEATSAYISAHNISGVKFTT